VKNDTSCQIKKSLYLREIKVEKALVKTKQVKCPKHLAHKTIKTELLLSAKECARIFLAYLLFL
jgi:hypothetical protein